MQTGPLGDNVQPQFPTGRIGAAVVDVAGGVVAGGVVVIAGDGEILLFGTEPGTHHLITSPAEFVIGQTPTTPRGI